MPRLPLLVVLCLTASACNPCAERCRTEAAAIDTCIDSWDLQWTDFGAVDAKSFRDRCVEAEQRWLSSLEGDEYRNEAEACSDLATDLRLAATCEATWEALTNYGSD